MNITPIIIDRFAAWVAGGVPWSAAKSIVTTLEDRAMTGQEKRRMAMMELEDIGYSLGKVIINLLIELAVLWMKEKR